MVGQADPSKTQVFIGCLHREGRIIKAAKSSQAPAEPWVWLGISREGLGIQDMTESRACLSLSPAESWTGKPDVQFLLLRKKK